jgi:Enoyl-(Acyl carrier protein) reductase
VADLDNADYVASKRAVIMLTRAGALEYAQKNIRVNAVCPGPMRTPMVEALAKTSNLTVEQFSPQPVDAAVSLDRLSHADREPGQWMSMGRDADAAFYSPLKQIDTSTVSRLGFAWQFKTGTYRGESMWGPIPRFTNASPGDNKPRLRGVLKAWDPIAGRIVWEQQTSQDYLLMDGGTLSTAGGRIA